MNKFTWMRMLLSLGLTSIIFLTSPLISLSQQKLMGELTITGAAATGDASFVTINGTRAVSGQSVMSPAEVVTPAQTSAKITIGRIGRAEFGPNSKMNLTFDENRIAGVFTAGSLTVAAAPNTNLNIQTVDGVITNQNQFQENIVIIDFVNGKTRVKTVAGVVAFNGALVPAGQIGGVGGAVAGSSGSILGSTTFIAVAVVGGALAAIVTAVAVSNSDEQVVSPVR